MKRFLIVKPSSLGDVIHAFPAVSLLKEHEKDSSVDWLIAPQFEELVRYHPAVDRTIHFRRRELGKFLSFPKEFVRLCSELRKEKYDAVIDLQGLLRSAAVSFCAKSVRTAGPFQMKESCARIFYGQKLHFTEVHSHAVRKNLEMMADFLGIPVPEKAVFEFPENAENRNKALALLGSAAEKRIIAAAPGARWKSKEWPPEIFGEILKGIREKVPGCTFVLLGSSGEVSAGRAIAEKLSFPVLDLTGKTSIGELAEIIRLSEILLCNDSGPMHIGSAAGTKVLAFFGPTDPVLTGPYAEDAEVFVPEIPCVRCFRKECPAPLCHRAIPPEKIARAAELFLQKRDASAKSHESSFCVSQKSEN